MTDQKTRLHWVDENCRLLQEIRTEFADTRPFEGITIGTGIHLEPKTAALLLTLKVGGARVVATGNLSNTQPATIEYLRCHGIDVHAEATQDSDIHAQSLQKILAEKPDLLLDNGGDLFAAFFAAPYEGLIGGTEETTSGRMRLTPLRDQLAMPILVINDSPIKQFAENKHAVGQSIFESYMRLTNRATNGKRVAVFGYGTCGMGVAVNFRNAFAQVSVIDVDPVKSLEAHFDGFQTPSREMALREADIIVTETGAENVITASDLDLLKDGAILLNGRHFPTEIDVPSLQSVSATRATYAEEGTETLVQADGRRIHILCNGHMANLAGPRPLGNSVESMDIGFALQSRCLERIAKGESSAEECVVPVPRAIDEQVANAYLSPFRQ
ncbi:MAG: adenosylhomocysteinase [Cognatishimia sp.]|nr:adenosylhomocysteinase [Cognatishimia sp.]